MSTSPHIKELSEETQKMHEHLNNIFKQSDQTPSEIFQYMTAKSTLPIHVVLQVLLEQNELIIKQLKIISNNINPATKIADKLNANDSEDEGGI